MSRMLFCDLEVHVFDIVRNLVSLAILNGDFRGNMEESAGEKKRGEDVASAVLGN